MSRPLRVVGDVSALPTYAFGHRSIMWWGTLAFMLIEGTGFALAAGAYLYLRGQVDGWPPSSPPPGLLWGSLVTVLFLLTLIPNLWTSRQAHAERLGPSRLGVIAMTLVCIPLVALRALEFTTLNERWDHNAYGSIVWALMILHTLHLVTDMYDTAVLAVVMHTHEVDGRRFSDVADNAAYWNFVVATWIPIYALLYWFPRVS
jgi:heme/copper-type cytochrome/quinol oxidase subunit 3